MKTFLLLAYACEPDKGSEPGVGWNWALEIARRNRVIVITRTNNRESIEKFLENQTYENISFEYCDVPKGLSFWKKGQKGLYLYYFLWQLFSLKRAKTITKRVSVDYAMAVTFGNIWLPTFIHKLPCDCIWGPLGGGEAIPKAFWEKISFRQRTFEKIRRFNARIPLTNPFLRGLCKKSKLILVRTKDTERCIPRKFQNKCLLCIETGISQKDLDKYGSIESKAKAVQVYDFVVVGKLTSFKQVNIAIDAFSAICQKDCVGKLHIIGDGPEKASLQRIVEEYRIESQVVFHGNVSHDKVLEIMSACHAVVMPSLKEGGSWVMYEAMLLKKPMICFNHAGMAVVETEETAILIPVIPYEAAVKKFAEGMQYLAENPEASQAIGVRAFEHVKADLQWKNHVDRMYEYLGNSSI